MQLKLKEIRKRKKMTQKQVADRVGISQSFYTEMETGKKEINVSRLERIARVLECSVHDLISDEQDPELGKLISLLNQMPEDKKSLVLQMVETLQQ